MNKKRDKHSETEGTSADALEPDKPEVFPVSKKEPSVSLAELIVMKKVPHHHAHALKIYVGDDSEKPLSKWVGLYQEMMTKPTNMSKEEWRKQFKSGETR